MKIASSVQVHLQKVLKAANSLEPITFCGMYDCGMSYIFSLAISLLTSELKKDITLLSADVSSSTEKTLEELVYALRRAYPNIQKPTDYLSLTSVLEELASKQKIVFLLYLGQDGKVDSELLPFLNRLRIVLGWKFSYCLFLTTRFLFLSPASELMDNLVRQTAVPVLPRSPEDTRIVIQNYEERRKKTVTKVQTDSIVSLSGGNPGLIKALFLQAVENPTWRQADMLDEHLFYRLQEIASDLPEPYIHVMVHGKKRKDDELIENLLLRYGYIKNERNKIIPFTPLLVTFIQKYYRKTPLLHEQSSQRNEQIVLRLSKSQRLVFAYLCEHPGKIVSKDSIAKLLWRDNWENKYSAWAIDQLISVLREKLVTIRNSGKIVTKKGEGLIYLPQ